MSEQEQKQTDEQKEQEEKIEDLEPREADADAVRGGSAPVNDAPER